jgi:hypothetical protein
VCTGRCVCGYTAPAGLVEAHQVSCPNFAAAYRADPDSIFSPADEYASWLEHGKPAAKTAAHEQTVADTDTRRAAMATRFATRDFLDD